MKKEIIYINECHHLYCCDIEERDCLKRYYTVYDYRIKKEVRLAVCNEYLRLQIYKEKEKEGYYSDRNSYNQIITKIVNDYIPKASIGNNYFSKSIITDVNFLICERPWVYQSMDIKKATMLLMERYDEWTVFHEKFFEQYKYTLREYCNYMLRYKKYIKEHLVCKKIINRLKHSHDLYYNQDEILELFNLILTLKIRENESK